ncbi:sensor histidine kinase YesM [Paenibacillus anaericanus]|uniref:Sensor histidine kinase n=1 Tax=Paenibacillus anaericanus TaxID=170367 RepID=A0A3S1DMA6_9BACL|nr:sensor histidine kinase [Paenibacillus anaericanus]MDQ0088251.1 sensor histidine kinase YesM [Paenibacillus anaericanus]RUT47794.1 sensor histidine kinase [Paenibacillus anaericanus]
MNLRIKLFTAFIALVIIPLFVLGIITFFVTFNSIESRHSQQAEYSLKAISYSIKNVFHEMDNLTDTGIAKGVFQAAIVAKDPDSQNLTATTQLELNANQKNFRSLLYNHPAIDYAFLYNVNGGVGDSNVISIFNKENFQTLPYEKFKEHPLFNEVMSLRGMPKWIAPHEYPELTGSDKVFTEIRLIKDLSNFHRVGVLVVQIKDWEFEKIFQNLELGSNMRDTRFMLVNDKGLILYDYQSELDGQSIQSYMKPDYKFSADYQSFKGKFNGEESIISIYNLKEYPWSLVSVTSWSYLSKELTTFAKWFVAIICICVLTAMLFNLVFMNRITGTIGVIVRFMRKVEDGDLNARVDEKGDDELLLLQKGFNNQMDKINELFHQVKREQLQKANAELRVLQAQIKPHFLFNTLESINVLAVQNEGRKVSEMVLRLASILRISIQDKEEIKLSLEVEHLRSYLEIQKFRFDELFEYHIDIPDEMMNCLLLKLTLQPLVENSIQHGFEGIDYIGKIKVTGIMEEDRILLRIEDNGIGMTSEQLSSIQYADIDDPEYDLIEPYPNHERRGLGLRSVFDRLRFKYGSKSGLFICSQPGQGTIIQCVIPKYELGDKN